MNTESRPSDNVYGDRDSRGAVLYTESLPCIHERSPLNAARWLRDLYEKIETLEHSPERCAFAREREFLEDDLRQLEFKSHRVVFLVDKEKRVVSVLSVRQGKRRAIGEPEGEEDRVE